MSLCADWRACSEIELGSGLTCSCTAASPHKLQRWNSATNVGVTPSVGSGFAADDAKTLSVYGNAPDEGKWVGLSEDKHLRQILSVPEATSTIWITQMRDKPLCV